MTPPSSTATLDDRSRQLRHRAIDALAGGRRGHIGSTMSLIEIMRVLYDDILTVDPADPASPTRDRLILSKGHGCIALYVMLAERGFFPTSQLATFCRFDSILGGHPEYGHAPGVEASTGSLGHGLAVGVGMALAARIRREQHRVVVVLGDGELDEGSVWESALAAGHHRLANLTAVVDCNALQSYGPVAQVWNLEPLTEKWRSFGFTPHDVDGHDLTSLRSALRVDPTADRPQVVIARTVKGRGIDFAEHDPHWHHKSSLSATDVEALRSAIDRA
ncbi:MAG: transketolase [Actinomycetales bacterium]|nr:transketolase [Actinomycetales bacterium]